MNDLPALNPFSKNRSTTSNDDPNLLWWFLVVAIFLVGLAVRFFDLSDPPLDFHPNRQMHSVLIARGMYFQQSSSLPAWQREMAVGQWQMEGRIEPQVFERVVAVAYKLAGGEDLRIPRAIAVIAWTLGAIFITRLAVNLSGLGGALAAAWFMMVWPYGVVASRSFQPEPIAIMLIGIGLWAAVGWREHGGWKWALATGLFCGFAIYVKVVSAFIIGPALLVLVLTRGRTQLLRDPQVWVIALLTLLPYVVYHINGVYIQGFLVDQFNGRFFPSMWIDPAFYLRWLSNLGRVLAFELTLISLLGVFLIRRFDHQVLLLALWLGYFIYGMSLPHHISTHDYYHLLLFPTLALGLAGIGEIVTKHMTVSSGLARFVLAVVVVAALIVNGYSARTTLKRFDASGQAQVWQEIGEKLGVQASVVALVPDYGVGLKYWAWINPFIWPTSDDIRYRQTIGQPTGFSDLYNELAAGRKYFVITALEDLENQLDLKKFLDENYSLIDQTPFYLIYELQSADR